MTATLIDGKASAAALRAQLTTDVAAFSAAHGRPPGLATVLIGDDAGSQVYVAGKQRACAEVGILGFDHRLAADVPRDEVLALLDELNVDPAVSGIICQLPVPGHLDGVELTNRIAADKDVDGLHPVNLGRLALGMPGPVPCTPAGIEALLAHHGIEVAGQEVCILGRGTTLGRPLALLLTQKRPTANAAVTVVHTGVPNWAAYTRRAAIVVAAVGVPNILQPEHISPGATVVGGGVRYEGRRLLPDVDEACNEVAGAITPRVGGVGPTTVAMLFKNCVEAAERRLDLRD